MLDGAQALHKATRAVFGAAARMQRCQVHKLRNILDHLPERQRPWVQAIVRRAYPASDVRTATRLLTELAKRLADEYPSAAGSVREGLDETLTVLTLHLSTRLQRSLATTNAVERLLSRTRPREAQRETVAWWTDDAAVGGCRCSRSRQGLPASEGMRRYAALRPPRFAHAINDWGSVSQGRTSRRISPEPPPSFNSGRDIPCELGNPTLT